MFVVDIFFGIKQSVQIWKRLKIDSKLIAIN